MYIRVQKAKQKWGGSLTVIDHWLDERQKLIASYCKLAGLPPFETNRQTLPTQETVREFCQLLMDYLSAAHFEIYEKIISGTENNDADIKQLAASLYPKIAASTDLALNFNDNYAEHLSTRFSGPFDLELSALGQALEERFELEDQLIDTLHGKHANTSASEKL